MRVLVIHNLYRSENASGENLSVLDEIDGLRALGWDVEVLSADSDAITQERSSLVKVGLRPVYAAGACVTPGRRSTGSDPTWHLSRTCSRCTRRG